MIVEISSNQNDSMTVRFQPLPNAVWLWVESAAGPKVLSNSLGSGGDCPQLLGLEMSTDIHRWWSYYSGRFCGTTLLNVGTSKTGSFCCLVVLGFVYHRKVCVTWVCCRKVILQPKLPFTVYIFKVKVVNLKQKACLMGKKLIFFFFFS